MKRVFICVLLSFIFVVLWQSLSIFLPSSLNIFLVMPLVIFFVSQFFKPLEIIFSFLFIGLIIDSLSGSMIGISSLNALFIAFVVKSANIFSSRVVKSFMFFYVVIFSFSYRVFFLLLQFFFAGGKMNYSIASFILGPIFDGVINFLFFYLLVKLLLLTKSFEHYEFSKITISV
jgi:cell shape-determining protein MreD